MVVFGFFFVIYVNFCFVQFQYVTAEKEKQLKEVMKIMGLDNWLHWTSWFCKSFIVLAVSAVLITIIMKVCKCKLKIKQVGQYQMV